MYSVKIGNAIVNAYKKVNTSVFLKIQYSEKSLKDF